MVNSIPFSDEVFGNTDYRTAMADYYGVPNGMITPHVGMMIKGKPLDPMGTCSRRCACRGGGRTKQHDTTKWVLADLMAECDIDCTTEVFGLFSPCISQRDAFNGQPARKRQAMVPDYHVLIANRPMLMELKMVHQGGTYFNPTTVKKRNGGVEMRAGTIQLRVPEEGAEGGQGLGTGRRMGPGCARSGSGGAAAGAVRAGARADRGATGGGLEGHGVAFHPDGKGGS